MNEIRQPYKKKPKDRYWKGLIAGFGFPFVGFAVLLMIYDQLDAMGFVSDIGLSADFRERTLSLVAICTIIIPANYFKKNYMTESLRGITIPLVVFVAIWLYMYAGGLFS